MRHRKPVKKPFCTKAQAYWLLVIVLVVLLPLPFLPEGTFPTLMGGFFFMSLAILYFLPAFIARDCVRFPAIAVANLLVAWTVIGWGIVLIWAIGEASTARDKALQAARQSIRAKNASTGL